MLPARVPNLLVNGSSGIAVGIATRIPPHNLREVVSGLHALIDKPDITIPELMEHIPAPDFPTGVLLSCGRLTISLHEWHPRVSWWPFSYKGHNHGVEGCRTAFCCKVLLMWACSAPPSGLAALRLCRRLCG